MLTILLGEQKLNTKGVPVEKNLAEDFALLFKKVDSDGSLDEFFHNPSNFGKGSNDFAACMLILRKLTNELPSASAQRVKQAERLCSKAVDDDVEPPAKDRREWALIHLLMAALADCAAHYSR